MCCSKLPKPTSIETTNRYWPDVNLLAPERPEPKNDVGLDPDIITPDPFASDDCLNAFSPDRQLLTRIEDVNTMNTGEDELSSGLNGRLRPRKTTVPSPQINKSVRKSDGKTAQDRPKRTSTPSKASSTKADDLSNKSDLSTALQLLCPHCDRKFASKQAISKHVRRIHFASSKQYSELGCLFCKHTVPDSNDIIRHMVDSHPNQYFACLDCHTRFPSTTELAEHKLNVCEKQKVSYRNKLRQKTSSRTKKNQKSINVDEKDNKDYTDSNRFSGIVISCELKPSQVTDNADIEDNITTNLILPPSKTLGTNAEIEKNAVLVLDDLQWSKRMPANFSFHNTDADQILSRLGVVHRSPRNSEFAKKDWLKNIDESTQKFEKCFDTSFYSKVASNVQENLSKFLDGSFNFNPDADSTIKTRKLKNSVVINTAEGFPVLLAFEQFTRTTFDGYMPRAIAPKHKWKWDNEKNPMNPDDIKRDTHVNNCIITLVSSLDIWTQLRMRRKFEDKFSIAPLEKKSEKQNTISKELKEILESREIPSTSSQVVNYVSKPDPPGDCTDFPASLGLRPAAPTYDLQPAVLSGEWVRPRCYVCCACGAQTRDSRGLSSHISTHHPNSQVQHYEIVGERLLSADILKHLYVPPSLLNNRTRPLRGFRECTKCKTSISLEDLHQHMLDCAGDTPTVRRKCRYRPFGVRRRRPRVPDNTIRKKIRKDIRRQTRQTRKKNLMRPRPKIRTEVGDAETIRKMIADLPAKRHRALVTPTNPIPRKKIDQQRNKLILKRRTTENSQSRKQQDGNRNTNNRLRPGPSQEDNDEKSIKDDDDKPLKPRLKRLVTKSSRQNDSFKRNIAINRAKRRAQLKEQTVVTEEDEPKIEEQPPVDSAAGSGIVVEQLSIGNNTPQKIDVNNGPYNTREHSSRNRNNNYNNDQESSGSSGNNGNMNNAFMPAPNEPLKHSIARLTSESEIYDQTLQFHHQMLLLQQECNSLNQHVPVGQQRLFENEAVVTKLDKPPLHFQQRGMIDPFSFQRNKFNKPRKGLNDCIAMLKNKLFDPIIPTPSSHSVECGSDEALLCQSTTTNRRLSSAEYEVQDVNSRPAEVFSRHHFINDRLFQLRNESNLIHQGFADIPIHFLTAQKFYEMPQRRGQRIEKVKTTKQKQSVPRRESTRRRSTRTEKDNTRNKKYVLPSHIELIPHKPPESYPAKVSPLSKLDSLHCQNLINKTNNDTNKSKSNLPRVSSAMSRKQIRERQNLDAINSSLNTKSRRISNETHLLEIKQSEAIKQPHIKHAEPRLRSSSKRAEFCTQSQTKESDIYTQTQLQQTDAYTKSQQKRESFTKPLQKHAEVYTQCQLRQSEAFAQTQLMQFEAYPQHQVKESEAYTQSQVKRLEAYTKSQAKQIDSYSQTQLQQILAYSQSQIKQSEAYQQSQLNQSEVYAQSQLKISEAYKQSQGKKTDSHSQTKLKQIVASQSQMKQSEAYSQTQVNQSEPNQQSQLKQSEVYAQSQLKISEAYTQSQGKQTDSYSLPQLNEIVASHSQVKQSETFQQSQMKQSEVYAQCQLQISEAYTQSLLKEPEFYSQSQMNQTEAYLHTQLKQTEVYSQPQLNEGENYIQSQISPQKPSVVYTESSFNKNIPGTFPERDVPRIIITQDIYSENVFNPSGMQLQRTNSNSSDVEPVVPVPLDLSVNITDSPGTSTKQNDSYESNDYDSYETLDLSNKSVDHISEDLVVDDLMDGVVDLRVKSSQESQKILDHSSETNEIESPTDLTLKTLQMENIPTDLTVPRESAVYEYEHIDMDYECVQDLSKYGQNSDTPPQIVSIVGDIIDQDIPTDLSGKKDIEITPRTIIKTVSVDDLKNAVSVKEKINSIGPADLSARKEGENQRNEDDLITAENHEVDIDIEKSQDSYDVNEVQSLVMKSTDNFKDNNLKPYPRTNDNRFSEQIFNDSLFEPEMPLNHNDSHVATVTTAPESTAYDVQSYTEYMQISTICKDSSQLHPEGEKCDSYYCQDSALPLYTLSNTTLNPRSKYESTMPVYTLANACISMSKIEPPSGAPNKEPTFGIPEITVAKDAPHCTLTDSSTRSERLATVVEGNIQDTSSTIKKSSVEARSTSCLTQNSTAVSLTVTSVNKPSLNDKCSTDTNIDLETAKKIALLPKELVEILGTMPVDHRNQLLNVLPHYVSKSPTGAQSKDSSSAMPVTTAMDTSPLTCPITDSSHAKSPIHTQNNEEIKPFMPMPNVSEIRIIDLTKDDPPVESKVKKISNEICGTVTITTVPKINKPKVNDQTASLRAVRIKTPSERNKSICIEKQILKGNVEQIIQLNVKTLPDLQFTVEKLDKTMAIQQAEVSSTQHNPTSFGNYPLAISPASTESSSDEASKNVVPNISITAVNNETEKTKEQNILFNIPLPKSKVSSSVSSKESNGFNIEPVVSEVSHISLAVGSPTQVVDNVAILSSMNIENNLSFESGVVSVPSKSLSTVNASSLDQEDSEDDITLAAIVKQKQHDSKTNVEKVDVLECGNKKKKSKKTKKSGGKTVHRNSNEHHAVCENLEEQSNEISFINTTNNAGSEMLSIDKCDGLDTKVPIEPMAEITRNKSHSDFINERHSQSSLKSTENDSQIQHVINDFTRQSKNIELSENNIQVTKKLKKDSLKKDMKHIEKESKVTNIHRKKGKGKKNLPLDEESKQRLDGKITILTEKEKRKMFEKADINEANTAECKQGISVDCLQIEEKLHGATINTSDDVAKSTFSNSELSDLNIRNEVGTESLKDETILVDKNNIEIHTTSQDQDFVQYTYSKDDFVATPLRRSRRGKSLFMDSHALEKEIMNSTEIVSEHKTPLTKKQLIFSKLLLDEGKLEPDKTDIDKSEDYKNESVLDTNISVVSNITEADKLTDILEKSKATKRKISPHSARKSKKKKSIDEFQKSTNESIFTKRKNDVTVLVDSAANSTFTDAENKPLIVIDKMEDNKFIIEKVCLDFPVSQEIISDSSLEVEEKSKTDEKISVSSEKRKIDIQLSSDLSRSSKPKKSKTVLVEKDDDDNVIVEKADDDNVIVEKADDDNVMTDSTTQHGNGDGSGCSKKDECKTENILENPTPGSRTACYNIPVPARRGRSKSVVVKSSGSDLYDPYDIDLEDMIEQHESFRRKKKVSVQKSGNSQKKFKEISLTTKDTSKIHTVKDDTKDGEKNTPKNKTVMSDSDDSSKSDVPLQKYVDGKEKKNLELEVSLAQKINIIEKLKGDKKYDITNDVKSVKSTPGEARNLTENEAERKLRSEQFMESFGFFSERKPRKSNLLASKKISETFHINNESDDMYFGFKERSSKKGIQHDKDIKKSTDNESPKLSQPSSSKKAGKRGRKKKSCTKILPSYCSVCKKEFRRPDNYLRHQITLLHISKLSEVEMKVKTAPVNEEPNYLIAYKQYLERFKKLTDKLFKLKRRNPKAASKIVLPSMQEILSDVNRAVREQQLSQRGLSHDEELFIDCCELLKESHNGDKASTSGAKSSISGLDRLENAIDSSFSNDCESDDDMDSITAQNILNSEEVRNLENDLISGLKEAAKATRKSCNIECQSSLDKLPSESENQNGVFADNNEADSHYEIVDYDIPEKPRSKAKKHCSSTEFIQIKEKMYPDVIEDIDMFEDKFDKIKRKCRSQAAAAKQTAPIVELCTSHKVRRKSEKKKAKRISKKTKHQSTQVPTKGALKGFDGIKVSIPTSDINLSAIVPVAENSSNKKKKKTSSKKKRDKKDSESSSKYDTDHRGKEGVIGQNKKLDVYEFMDNEDAELFEFRPSTLMERFKSISNKETPSTSKFVSPVEDNSSESASDGDDFVYMSDDYVCSDNETENSLQSCENGNPKLGTDIKKMVQPQKRKDVVEKNAVMGKIFKHNAVRTEKKITPPKETVKPKANLDQLFDSLLEDEPSATNLNSELDSLSKDDEKSVKKHTAISSKYDSGSNNEKFSSSKTSSPTEKIEYAIASTSKRRSSFTSKECTQTLSKDPQKHESLSKKYTSEIDYKLPMPKKLYCLTKSFIDYGPSTSKKYDNNLEGITNVVPEKCEKVSSKKNDEMLQKHCESKQQKHSEASTSKYDEDIELYDDSKSSNKKDRSISSSYDYVTDVYDQSVMGVARQRARRKCTVGKQNILAESWSSESEPDGGPPRPNSAESVVAGSGRKKKGRKKDGQQAGGRRGNNRQVTFKKYDIESRVNSSNRNTSSMVSIGGLSGSVDDGEVPGPSGLGNPAAMASTSAVAAAAAAAAEAAVAAAAAAAAAGAAAEAAAAVAMPAPSTSQAPATAAQRGRPRSITYYWTSEGGDEQEQQQQHGWIVGDSHKKLVTMLAHAKGRKRNNDDKRHLVE